MERPRGESQKKLKVHGFYKKMIPAFTTDKRMKLYQKDPRKGFTYVNWEIEIELHRFQKEIESRFKASQVNQQFKFPRLPAKEPENNNKQKKQGTQQRKKAVESA